jgi:A/G-specific adenine glycosylase
VGKGIWHNLYEFPLLETDQNMDTEDVIEWLGLNFNDKNINNVLVFNDVPLLHKLTHQHLFISFYIVNVNQKISDGILLSDLKLYPFPIVIYNFIEKYSL